MIDKFEFYKEAYYKELDRRDALTNALNVPITVLTGLIAINSYMFLNYSFTAEVSSYFKVLSAVNIVSLVVTIIMLIYSYLAKPEIKLIQGGDVITRTQKDVENQIKENQEKYTEFIDVDAEKYTASYSIFIACTDHNIKSNDSKSNAMYNAKISLCINIALTLICLFFFTKNVIENPKKNQTTFIMSEKDKPKERPTVFVYQPTEKPRTVKNNETGLVPISKEKTTPN